MFPARRTRVRRRRGALRRVVGFALACSLALLATGCGRESPTTPISLSTERPVGVTVADSLGTPAASAMLWATSQFNLNGYGQLIAGTTDESGEALLRLRPGGWILAAKAADGRVAGGQALIADPGSHADSVLVRLVVHTPSRVDGHARLAGRTDHRGILVSVNGIPLAGAVTDSSGAYALDGMPPGTWTLIFDDLGFGTQTTNVTVPAPGSTVQAADVTLLSSP